MAPPHRSLGHWSKDVIRQLKPSAKKPGEEQTKDAGRSADLENPADLTANVEQLDNNASGNCVSATQTLTPTNADSESGNEAVRVAGDLGAANVVDKVGECQAPTTAENVSGAVPPAHPETSQIPPRDEKSPIWSKSIARFENEKPEEYKLMMRQLEEITNLKDLDTWDTWLNRQGLDNGSKETKYKWLRICKAYMPSVATVRVLALGFSSLDPHKVAPLVVTGVFVLAELCFGLMDPATSDKAMGLLLKTNIVINKWASHEDDLKRMKIRRVLEVDRIEQGLDTLYFDSLVLMSSIYLAGRSRTGRFAASFTSGPLEWERAYQNIQNKDSACGVLKGQVESMLKNSKENIEVLDWIGNRKDDPEPLHQTVKERTGIDDADCLGGIWFLETPEFSSWIDDIRQNRAETRAFWLKGSMGTGKTTLICRAISHFQDAPLVGVNFVSYYCHGSGSGPGPQYETIVRALCRRLAWKSDGSVADDAMRLYHSSKEVPDAQLTVKSTWEPLLHKLIASSPSTIVFILDALDECDSPGSYKDVLKFLARLPQQPNGPYMLVSSRPHVPVGVYLGASVQTFDVIHPETKNEMKNFIESQINSKMNDKEWEKSIFFKKLDWLEELKSALSESAGGMFRWVEIWLGVFFPRKSNAVRRESKARELLDKLKAPECMADIPHDPENDSKDDKKKMAIKKAYDSLWDINGDCGSDSDLQVRLFQIITASFKSLTPQALLEAVCFNPSQPEDYEDLELDHIEGLYSSFLKVNSNGYLEYEHLSAKIFVEEIRDFDDEATFSSDKSHRRIAEIGICAIERPHHSLWTNSGIDLLGCREDVSALLLMQDPALAREQKLKRYHSDPRPKRLPQEWEKHPPFGRYLLTYWLRHCLTLNADDQFLEKMGKLFRRAHLGFQGWVCYHAVSSAAQYHQTLTYEADENIANIRPSPLLCTVSFGLYPASYCTNQAALPRSEDPSVRNLEQQTALHIACRYSRTNIVKDLLQLEHTINGSCYALLTMRDNYGHIPLGWADNIDIIKTLLEHEMHESPGPPTTSGSWKSKLLESEDLYRSMEIRTILRRTNSEDMIKWIINECPIEPWVLDYLYNDQVQDRCFWKIEVFLKNGADPNIRVPRRTDNSLFASEMNDDKLTIIKLLLGYGVIFEDCDGDAIVSALRNHNVDRLELLLDMGVDIDTKNKSGYTALGIAVRSYGLDIIEYLFGKGADVHASQGMAGTSVLHLAVARGDIEIAGLLLDRGADVNSVPSWGSTKLLPPLAVAVTKGKREMAEYLISRGADEALLSTDSKTEIDALLER